MNIEQICERTEQGFYTELKTGLENYQIAPFRPSVVAQPTDEKYVAINVNGKKGTVLSKAEFVAKMERILPFVV